MLQDVKKGFRGDKTDAERALSVLDTFCEKGPRNTAEFVVDAGTDLVRVVMFQSTRMRRLFCKLSRGCFGRIDAQGQRETVQALQFHRS
ncbi:hypothetical protein GQ600_25301 [Phytophthora cactorum]|nr:hypothetical protein GQ600_25301 [Phytophthora cactorum]